MRFWVRIAASKVVELIASSRSIVTTSALISAKSGAFQRISARILLELYRYEGHKNVVGPRVRKLRWEQKLKQKELAAQLEIAGWQLDRAGVSKVESRFIKVSDYQLLCLMHVLKVDARELLPSIDLEKPIDDQIRKLMESGS